MCLELYDLVDSASGGAEHYPIKSKYIAAAMMPLMIGLGGLHRFVANEARGGKSGMASMGQIVVGWGGFVASCVVFGVVVASILDPLAAETCPDDQIIFALSDGRCDNLKNERTAAFILTLTWTGYPFVVFLSSIANRVLSGKHIAKVGTSANGVENTPATRTHAYVSFFKDVCFGILDVVSKGGACAPRSGMIASPPFLWAHKLALLCTGLALYCAYRYTWVTD